MIPVTVHITTVEPNGLNARMIPRMIERIALKIPKKPIGPLARIVRNSVSLKIPSTIMMIPKISVIAVKIPIT